MHGRFITRLENQYNVQISNVTEFNTAGGYKCALTVSKFDEARQYNVFENIVVPVGVRVEDLVAAFAD